VLGEHDVAYVVTGSTAALLLGVDLVPGDLDITPALDAANLGRLARALSAIEARPDPDGPLGDWQVQPDGERRWVERTAQPGEREARLAWRPDPANPATFDHLLQTRHGALDVVPEIAGSYEELRSRASSVEAPDQRIWVESIADQLATLTIPRREKDRNRVRALRILQKVATGPQASGPDR
jgi:hypothetical protein